MLRVPTVAGFRRFNSRGEFHGCRGYSDVQAAIECYWHESHGTIGLASGGNDRSDLQIGNCYRPPWVRATLHGLFGSSLRSGGAGPERARRWKRDLMLRPPTRRSRLVAREAVATGLHELLPQAALKMTISAAGQARAALCGAATAAVDKLESDGYSPLHPPDLRALSPGKSLARFEC